MDQPHLTPRHCTTLHLTSLHVTPHHDTTRHNTTNGATTNQLRSASQHSTTCHITTWHNTALRVTSRHTTSLHVTPHHDTTLHNTAPHVTPRHATSRHITIQHNTPETIMNTASLILILAAQIPAGLIRLDATIDTPPGEPPLHATTWAIYDDTSGTVTDSELRMMGLGWSGHPETRDGVHLGHDQLDWDLFTGLDSPHWAVRWDLPATEHLLALSGSIDTSHGGAFWRHGEDILFNPTWIAVASTRTALGALVPEPHGVTFAIIAAAVFAAVYWKSERAFEAKR